MATVTIKSLADMLKCSICNARKLVRSDNFPRPKHIKAHTREVHWDEGEVKTWVESYTRTRTSQQNKGAFSGLDNNLARSFLMGQHDHVGRQLRNQKRLILARRNDPKTKIIRMGEANVQSSRDANPWAGLF